jgi:hypothetical protein
MRQLARLHPAWYTQTTEHCSVAAYPRRGGREAYDARFGIWVTALIPPFVGPNPTPSALVANRLSRSHTAYIAHPQGPR